MIKIENITNSDYDKEFLKNIYETAAKESVYITILSNRNYNLTDKYSLQIDGIKLNPPYRCINRVKIYEGEELIFCIIANYSKVYFKHIKQNEQDFLLINEDYECITVLNLTTRERKIYGDLEALECGGCGFCPYYFDFDESENILKITGCVWGASEETWVLKNVDLNDLSITEDNDNFSIEYDDFEE